MLTDVISKASGKQQATVLVKFSVSQVIHRFSTAQWADGLNPFVVQGSTVLDQYNSPNSGFLGC